MTRAFGIIILAVVVSSGTTAAHHSNAMYFTTNAVTLEGEVARRVDQSTRPCLPPGEE
ncbi:MAG TPA: hypothetical protein VKB50_11825 [Vicinamibacterales bacterium]|nr:hypothetical protein [Vicinamibacterales bacterium]